MPDEKLPKLLDWCDGRAGRAHGRCSPTYSRTTYDRFEAGLWQAGAAVSERVEATSRERAAYPPVVELV